MTRDRPAALTIAGSDSGGGAGIQADLKTFHQFGVFGTAAVTAITAQNTVGVRSVQRVDPAIVADQILAVAEDLAPTAVKSGMLVDEEIIRTVASTLERTNIGSYVLDPVMVAASGARLLEREAVGALATRLVPLATLVTPNLEEAAILAGLEEVARDDMQDAADRIRGLGCGAVLLKGGHLDGDEVVDVLLTRSGSRTWVAPKHPVGNAHGTGCTLSAAITAGLALGRSLEVAVEDALTYVRRAVSEASPRGAGSRPLNHWARG